MCSNLFYIDIYIYRVYDVKANRNRKKTMTKLMMSVELGN